MPVWLNIFFIFLFMLVGSIFSGTEMALVSLRSSQVERMEQEDERGAHVARVARDPFLVCIADWRDPCRLPLGVLRCKLFIPSHRAYFDVMGYERRRGKRFDDGRSHFADFVLLDRHLRARSKAHRIAAK